MKIRTLSVFVALGLAALLCGGCPAKEVAGECSRDGDCPVGFFCSPEAVCKCMTDASCPEGEFCNSSGFCQTYVGCRTDADCGTAEQWRCAISETGSGQCLCRVDAACDSGEFCNTSGTCQAKAGCILDSDCGPEADWRCRINAETSIGECFCKTDVACEEAEFCNVHGYCQPNTSCTSNEDCPAGRFCNVAAGECFCNPEAQTGCEAGQVCNASGYCQPRPGCYDNRDCEDLAGTYCDFTTRTCVPDGQCTSDLQCALGTICRQFVCVSGCDDAFDCPLDQYCSNFQCVPGCQSDEFCDFAQFCVNGTCQNGYGAQTPYCLACDGQDSDSCGSRDNLCLIYPYLNDAFTQANSPLDEYCAPDCSGDQRCPNGFSCNSVITIKQTDLCQTNNDCPGTLPCLKSPEEDQGYCPCHPSLNPCMANTCFSSDFCYLGSCYAAGNSCSSAADCPPFCLVTGDLCSTGSCPPVPCETYDDVDYGGCVSAQACGLLEGVHCPSSMP